jgi:hypothetical protein
MTPVMHHKTKPKPDNPEQFKRFIGMAREVEADESPEALDRAFEKVIRPPHIVKAHERRASRHLTRSNGEP